MSIDAKRLVQVRAPTEHGTHKAGTGYAISPDLIITARHVLTDRDTTQPPEVRFSEELSWQPVAVDFDPGKEIDVCVLRLAEARQELRRRPIEFGEYDRTASAEWEGSGFPAAARVARDDGVFERRCSDLAGRILPLGGSGQYELGVDHAPIGADDWKGVSGGPVIVQGRLVGVLGSAGFSGSRLWATPLPRLLCANDQLRRELGNPRIWKVPSDQIMGALRGVCWEPGMAPSVLLKAENEAVPFWGREKELEQLRLFCEQPGRIAARVVAGSGGMGKTRLLSQACQVAEQQGWFAGFLRRKGERATWTLQQAQDLFGKFDRVFIAVDYAETRVEEVDELFRAAAETSTQLRLVMLCREIGDWWQSLLAHEAPSTWITSVPEVIRLTEQSLAPSERAEFFKVARSAFSGLTARQCDEQLPPLTNEAFGRPLLMEMAALAQLEQRPLDGSDQLLRFALGREKTHWSQQLESVGLSRNLERGTRNAVAIATLWGSIVDRECTVAMLQSTPLLHDQQSAVLDTIADLLHVQYGGRAWVNGLQPDLLGEQLVGEVLREGNSVLDAALRSAGDAQTKSALTVLTRLAKRDETGRMGLQRALTDLSKAMIAVDVAKGTGDPIGAILAESLAKSPPERDMAMRIANAIPESTIALREAGLVATRICLNGPISDAMRARLMNNLGNWQSSLGQREEALQSAVVSVEILRKLAIEQPDKFLPDLAQSLCNLAGKQSSVQQSQAALASAQDAVELCSKLAADHPESYLPRLARGLEVLGNCQGAAGQLDAALASSQKAADIYRRLAADHPGSFLAELAMVLNDLGNRHADKGQREDALGCARESVALYRRLVAECPDTYLPDLAMGLCNLGNRQAELRLRDGLESTNEAVAIYRRLAQTRPDAFTPNLAMGVHNLGAALHALGDSKSALANAQEAVDLCRGLAKDHPQTFLWSLADSLANLLRIQRAIGESDVDTMREEVSVLRRLAPEQPPRYLARLVESLGALGIAQSQQGNPEGGLESLLESTEILRQLATHDPATYLKHLAESLNNVAFTLLVIARLDDAFGCAQEAVELCRRLPVAHPELLASALATQALILLKGGRGDEARLAAIEAFAIIQPLADGQPDTFGPTLKKVVFVLQQIG